MELPNLIEAILFYYAEPLTLRKLAATLKRDESEVRDALLVLEECLNTSGIRLLRNNDTVLLGTAPDASALIEAITKEELSKDLSKSALETLAIVLYKGPLTRSEIDYIRGVNSTFILRNLLIRGLVEKVENPEDQRSFLYRSTFALLEYMGITNREELPEYTETLTALEKFIHTKTEEEKEADTGASAASETETPTEGSFLPEEFSLEPSLTEEEIAADIEADILEEDEAGANFDDEALKAHREHDEQGRETPQIP
jgi:segregation and condensation protein B